jgi:hypothetical protein
MRILSEILPLLALCGWVALVPVLDLEEASLEVPVVLECVIPAVAAEGCSAAGAGCPPDMPEDCPVRLSCCVCLQFGGLVMELGSDSTVQMPTPTHSTSSPLAYGVLTRSLRPPVPPPKFS